MSRFDLSLRGTGQGDDSMWRGAGGEAAPFLGLEGSLLGSDRVGGSATLDAFYREAMKVGLVGRDAVAGWVAGGLVGWLEESPRQEVGDVMAWGAERLCFCSCVLVK